MVDCFSYLLLKKNRSFCNNISIISFILYNERYVTAISEHYSELLFCFFCYGELVIFVNN